MLLKIEKWSLGKKGVLCNAISNTFTYAFYSNNSKFLLQALFVGFLQKNEAPMFKF
jgi:hypothetical protein